MSANKFQNIQTPSGGLHPPWGCTRRHRARAVAQTTEHTDHRRRPRPAAVGRTTSRIWHTSCDNATYPIPKRPDAVCSLCSLSLSQRVIRLIDIVSIALYRPLNNAMPVSRRIAYSTATQHTHTHLHAQTYTQIGARTPAAHGMTHAKRVRTCEGRENTKCTHVHAPGHGAIAAADHVPWGSTPFHQAWKLS